MFSCTSKLSASSSCWVVVLIWSVSSVSCTWLYTTSVTVEKITPKQSTAAPLRKKCLRGFFCFPCWGSSTTFSRAACCSSLRGSRSGSASNRTVLSLRSSNRERS